MYSSAEPIFPNFMQWHHYSERRSFLEVFHLYELSGITENGINDNIALKCYYNWSNIIICNIYVINIKLCLRSDLKYPLQCL